MDGGATGGNGGSATGGSAGSGGAGGSGATTDGAGGCTSTGACPTGQVCDRTSNRCVQCLIDGDCSVGTRCIDNSCQAPTTCRNSLDCAGAQNPVCDAATGQCVQCVVPNDCPDSNDCISQTCTPYLACNSSLDCPNRQVCETTIGRCVECITSSDCGDTRTCVGNACRLRCESDNQCTPLGLLCSPNTGYCAECLRDENCVESRFCSSGVCVPDVCTPGAQRCQDNAVQTCNAAGSGWASAACSTYQTCKETTSGVSCQNWICTPSTAQCDQTTERVMQCSADGLAQAVIQDCGTQVCVNATCKPVICSAGTRRCAGNIVYQCSTKGDAETVSDTCTSFEHCDDVTRACVTNICTPNQPACDGNVATTCNSIGSGYTGTRTTCTGQYCVNGVCSDQICVPNSRFCDTGNVVRQCSADGLSATLYQSCTTSQYCDDTTATCKAMICTPNLPACNGNSTTTCNSLGSGYTSAGTSCGSLYCVSGVCQTALFAEDWEDGDYNGWTVLSGSYTTRAVQNSVAANGTTWSLQLTKSGGGSGDDGLSRIFSTPLQPTRVSWWARAAQTNMPVAYFMMYPTSSSSDYIAWMYFNDTSQISCRGSGSAILRPYIANQWYHIEFRNINWTSRTFDYYIDNVLVQASVGMSGSGTAVGKLNLHDWSTSSTATAYWDQIEFQ
jgi:hypothetical protein